MINRYPLKNFPMVGVCGLDCGLCPRFHTDGKVKCPGCCGMDFYDRHPSCSLVNCAVRQKGIESCALCSDLQECPKIFQVIEASHERDTHISYKPITANIASIQKYGISGFARRQLEKQQLLLRLLDNYDDGRSKLFYCTACQLIPVAELSEAIQHAEARVSHDADIKEKSKLMRGTINRLADAVQIDLKLRNKTV